MNKIAWPTVNVETNALARIPQNALAKIPVENLAAECRG